MTPEAARGGVGSGSADAVPDAIQRALRPVHDAAAALQASLAAAARDVGAAASDALREAASGRALAEQRALALERELAASRAAADTERAEHAAALERARKQTSDERSRLLRELEASRAQAMQLRGSDLEAASLRTALTAAEGRVATARSAAAAAAASLASLDAKHTEVRSNYHRLYRKVMVSAPELVGKPSSRSNAAGGVAPSPFQPLMAHVEAALPSLLPSPTPAARPVEPAAEVEVAAPAGAVEKAVAAAPAPLPRPPAYDTVESDWVIRSTPDEQLQAMATADVAAAAAVACLPETNAGEEEDEEEDEDAPPHGDDYAAGGDADAAPSSEVTQCCTAAARGQPCAHRGGGWGHPVPVPRAPAPPAPPPQLPPPAVPAEKPWRKRGAAATGFLTDPVPRSSAKRERPAPAPAAGDDDARYLFTPPPDDADAAAAPGAARPPVALRDCSPLALPSPPSGARTVWTLEAAAPQPRAGGGRRARPANERPAPPGGRYAEVERNRDARAAMPAFQCVECAGFYAAMGMQGAPQPCSHGRGGAAAAAPGPTSHEEHLKHVGRHRAQWAPALTPAGFWNIGFDDDPAPPPPEERTRVTRPQNFCPGL